MPAASSRPLREKSWKGDACSERDLQAAPDVSGVCGLDPDARREGLEDQGADLIGEWQRSVQLLAVEALQLERHDDRGPSEGGRKSRNFGGDQVVGDLDVLARSAV